MYTYTTRRPPMALNIWFFSDKTCTTLRNKIGTSPGTPPMALNIWFFSDKTCTILRNKIGTSPGTPPMALNICFFEWSPASLGAKRRGEPRLFERSENDCGA